MLNLRQILTSTTDAPELPHPTLMPGDVVGFCDSRQQTRIGRVETMYRDHNGILTARVREGRFAAFRAPVWALRPAELDEELDWWLALTSTPAVGDVVRLPGRIPALVIATGPNPYRLASTEGVYVAVLADVPNVDDPMAGRDYNFQWFDITAAEVVMNDAAEAFKADALTLKPIADLLAWETKTALTA